MTKARAKTNANKEGRAKNARRRRDSRSKGLPRRSLTKRIYAETRNPPLASPSGKPQRVSITDSFGASPCHRPWITPQGATPAERLQH